MLRHNILAKLGTFQETNNFTVFFHKNWGFVPIYPTALTVMATPPTPSKKNS